MRKNMLMLIVGALIGGAGGFALGIFVYPYIFLADIVATDTVSPEAAKTILAQGTFTHANPSDPIHYGRHNDRNAGR